MLKIRTILAATDFSPMSEHAFRFAAALARDYAARLIALHVVPTPIMAYADAPTYPEQPDYSPAREALTSLRVPGVQVEYRLLEGEPAGTIGVLGPTRMNYPDAMAAVAVVSRRLGSRLSEI